MAKIWHKNDVLANRTQSWQCTLSVLVAVANEKHKCCTGNYVPGAQMDLHGHLISKGALSFHFAADSSIFKVRDPHAPMKCDIEI